jgi:hypothetical protein
MSEEKSTSHNVIVRLLSETPITYAAAIYALAKSIDNDILDENDLIIIGYDFNDTDPGSNQKTDRKPSKAAQKLKDIASRSPGALGDLFALLKGRKWHEIYLGFAAVVLIGTLLFKWLIRLIAGTFI